LQQDDRVISIYSSISVILNLTSRDIYESLELAFIQFQNHFNTI